MSATSRRPDRRFQVRRCRARRADARPMLALLVLALVVAAMGWVMAWFGPPAGWGQVLVAGTVALTVARLGATRCGRIAAGMAGRARDERGGGPW